MKNIDINVLTLLLVFSEVNAETYRVPVSFHGAKVYQDISVDRQLNLMTVSVGSVDHVSSSCKYSSTINLHDFQKRVLAIKHIDSGECYIMNNNETLKETQESLINSTRYIREHIISETKHFVLHAITYNEMIKLGGLHVEQFCRGYAPFIAIESAKDRRFLEAVPEKPALVAVPEFKCYFCWSHTIGASMAEKQSYEVGVGLPRD